MVKSYAKLGLSYTVAGMGYSLVGLLLITAFLFRVPRGARWLARGLWWLLKSFWAFLVLTATRAWDGVKMAVRACLVVLEVVREDMAYYGTELACWVAKWLGRGYRWFMAAWEFRAEVVAEGRA